MQVNAVTPITGKVIVLDAGHGGPDSGARSPNGSFEKHISLTIALKLQRLLTEAGAHVYLTRWDDNDLATAEDQRLGRRHQRDLRNRTRRVVDRQPDAFVSIHCNSVPSPLWRGAHTIYMEGNPEGERLAKLVQERFRTMLLPTHRSADDMSTLYLLKRIQGPAVLAEVGFLSNPDEAHHLLQSDYQENVATAIYMGVLDYFTHTPVQPEPTEG